VQADRARGSVVWEIECWVTKVDFRWKAGAGDQGVEWAWCVDRKGDEDVKRDVEEEEGLERRSWEWSYWRG